MGGVEFFDPKIAETVKAVIQSNAMTPSVARDAIQNLSARRSGFLKNVKDTIEGLETLGIKEASLPPGGADLAFLIPRDLFNNHLGPFSKELGFISHLIQDFSEAITGKPEPAELEELASSIPTVTVEAHVAVIAAIATIVHKFIEAWKKIEEIRDIRSRLTKMGMKGTAVEELTTQITTTVDQVVEESTEIVLVRYPGNPARKNELQNAIKVDTRRLFGQVERGLKIEFAAASKGDDDAADAQALATVANIGRQIEFPEITHEPMLLANGEILEGEIEATKISKTRSTQKTTTQKTTTTKKTPVNEDQESR